MPSILRSAAIAAVGFGIVLLAALPATAQRQGKPGDFDYYALVLSWSPSYCAGEGAGRGDPQCSGRPYAFVLHGLWPQYTRGYPESCPTGASTFVPEPQVREMLDIMPSRGLIIHEYKKHGSCSGLDSKAYFDLSRQLFAKVVVPEAYRSLDRPLVTSPGEITKAFVAANPGLKPEMVGVACGRPNRLREIRVCFSRDGSFKTCGSNENAGRLCRSPNVVLPPVRGGLGRRAG